MMADSQSSQSLKSVIYEWFRTHPHATKKRKLKDLMGFLNGLGYRTTKGYLQQCSSHFKTDSQNSQGLKGLNFHAWRGWIYQLKDVDRSRAVEHGWILTRSKNHYLLWKDGLGRLEWHVKGRVNVWVRKPVTEGKKLQLLANGFLKTWLIKNIEVFTEWAKTLHMKGVHCAADTGFELPYLKLDLFKESNGVILLLGDKTHRTSAELQIYYPDWAERNELMLQSSQKVIDSFAKWMQDLSSPKARESEQDRSFGVV